MTPAFDRVSVHGTPRWTLSLQARHLGLPLYEIEIPYPCTNDAYEEATRGFLDRIPELPADLAASHLAFGDLFLEDARSARMANSIPAWWMGRCSRHRYRRALAGS